MKNFSLIIAAMLLAGCGRESTPPATAKAQYAYPALNESSLPPAPPQAGSSVDIGGNQQQDRVRTKIAANSNQHLPTGPTPIPAEITGSGGLQIEIDKMEQIKQLRAYAAKAGPDDPFAMTEEEIVEFSKLDNPILE